MMTQIVLITDKGIVYLIEENDIIRIVPGETFYESCKDVIDGGAYTDRDITYIHNDFDSLNDMVEGARRTLVDELKLCTECKYAGH